jgi:hypothetical protein
MKSFKNYLIAYLVECMLFQGESVPKFCGVISWFCLVVETWTVIKLIQL